MSERSRVTRAVAIALVALLLVAGVVVTATAAPGPKSDVKTAQYGGHSDAAAHEGPVQGRRRRGGSDLPAQREDAVQEGAGQVQEEARVGREGALQEGREEEVGRLGRS